MTPGILIGKLIATEFFFFHLDHVLSTLLTEQEVYPLSHTELTTHKVLKKIYFSRPFGNILFYFPFTISIDCKTLFIKPVTSSPSARLWSSVFTARWYLVSGIICSFGVSSRPSCCMKRSKLFCCPCLFVVFFA